MPTKKSVINKKSQADRILKKLPANKITIFLNKFKDWKDPISYPDFDSFWKIVSRPLIFT